MKAARTLICVCVFVSVCPYVCVCVLSPISRPPPPAGITISSCSPLCSSVDQTLMWWPNPICIHISSPVSPSAGRGKGVEKKDCESGGGLFEFFWGVNSSSVTSLSLANSDQWEKVNLLRVLLLRGCSGETYLGGGSDQ